MTYLSLLKQAELMGLDVREKPLRAYNGRISGDRIAIKKDLRTNHKACILAEEIAHAQLTVGDILDQTVTENRKQELKARRLAHDMMITQDDLFRAAKAGCRNAYEISDFLDITEEFLQESIQDFKRQYGTAYTCDSFVIMYEPYLMVCDINDLET